MSENNNEDYRDFVLDDTHYRTKFTNKFAKRKRYEAPDPKKIIAAISGTTTELLVKEGDKVEKGEKLAAFNAMKMHNKIFAPRPGTVKHVYLEQGKTFTKDELLIVLE